MNEDEKRGFVLGFVVTFAVYSIILIAIASAYRVGRDSMGNEVVDAGLATYENGAYKLKRDCK